MAEIDAAVAETWFASPIGIVRARQSHGALETLEFEDGGGAVELGGPLTERFRRYFDGALDAFADVPLAPSRGTPFQRRVWEALRRIPAGEVASYGDVARMIGQPRAVRAVGAANGANPIAIVVPCHRVVRSDGSIGGYGGGLDRKRWLLDHERLALGAPRLFEPAADSPRRERDATSRRD